ncbi:MAG: EAL domain-containing protein [Alcanivoracaceae bacterium]
MRVKFSRALFLSIALTMLVVVVAGTLLAQQLVRDSVRRSASESLLQTSEYFIQQLGMRAGELVAATEVLTSDFGFREALASLDPLTIQSALENQVFRIGADHGVVRLSDGRIVTTGSSAPTGIALDPSARADEQARITTMDGRPYLLISTAVDAPLPSGQLRLAFSLGQDFINQFYHLIGADLSIQISDERSQPSLMSSRLLPDGRADRVSLMALLDELAEGSTLIHDIGDERLITMRVSAPGTSDVRMYLHRSLANEADTLNALAKELLILVIGAVVLVLVLSSWLSRRLTRPLGQFGQLAARMNLGDYQRHLPRQSITELSDLADAFNSMQDAIAERETRIAHQARYDSLTGLPNRLAALEFIRGHLERSQGQAHCGLLTVDIHHLRDINESFGQQCGDTVLRWLATSLVQAQPRNAQVFRIASDDFLMVIAGAQEEQCRLIARKMEQACSHPVALGDGLTTTVRLHQGIALSPEHGSNAEVLIQRAEQALYRAREKTVSVHLYDPEAEASRKRRVTLLTELKDALARNQLTLQLQPRIERDRPLEVLGDAQLRWEHPQFGDISGTELLTLIQTAGLASNANSLLLQQSCALIADWQSRRISSALSMDILADDLRDSQFVSRVLDITQRYGVHRSLIRMEINEALVSEELATARDVIGRLRRQQIKVVISQFGTGMASLALLRDIEVDEIRIERRFISNLGHSKADTAIVESIITLGHRLGIRVSADGVDNREQLSQLEQLGIDGVQGMVLGRIMSPSHFESWRDAWITSKKRSLA